MENVKMKHKEWRKLAKKQRRRRIRQNIAQAREKEESRLQQKLEQDPKYLVWLNEQKALELFKIQEEERINQEENQKWIDAELEAQKKWNELQIKLEAAREQKAKQQELIKKEWEEQQRRMKEEKELKEKILKEKQEKYEAMMQKIDDFINQGGEIPAELLVSRDTNPSKSLCPFFAKIGACRFGDSCSRNHQSPGVSKVLLIRNFYSHFGIEQCFPSEYETDVLLEYDDSETYAHFKEFFFDTIAEFKKHGRVVQYKVCCNSEAHLRGNVYVEYEKLREAVRAYKMFQGRWYGGKRLNVDFSGVSSWKNAICGMFFKKSCHKGRACNFLHVFQNPGNLFHNADRDLHRIEPSERKISKVSRDDSFDDETTSKHNWRWSESPERTKYSTPNRDDRDNSKPSISKNRHKSHRHDSSHSISSRSERRPSSHRHSRSHSSHGNVKSDDNENKMEHKHSHSERRARERKKSKTQTYT